MIIGASRPAQIEDNVRALELLPRLTQAVRQSIDAAISDYSESWVGDSPWHYED